MRKYLKEKFLRNKLRKFEEKNFASRTKKLWQKFFVSETKNAWGKKNCIKKQKEAWVKKLKKVARK